MNDTPATQSNIPSTERWVPYLCVAIAMLPLALYLFTNDSVTIPVWARLLIMAGAVLVGIALGRMLARRMSRHGSS